MIDREALKVACEAAYMSAPRNKPYRLVSAIARQNIERATEAAIAAYLTSAGEGAVPVGWRKLADEAARALTLALDGKNAGDTVEMSVSDLSVVLGLLAAAPHPPRQDGARELVERIAEWLHSEVEWPDPDFPQYSWPEHEDDTGQRGDGFLKIVPRDTREQFRDIARRLALFFAPATTRPAPDEAVEAVENDLPACTECGAPAGMDCRTIQGRTQPHASRARSRRDVGGGV